MPPIRPLAPATAKTLNSESSALEVARATPVDAMEAPPRAYAGQRLGDPSPPFAVARTFEEADEQRLMAQGPVLVAYEHYDITRQPVVLVHGMDGAPSDLLALAERLQEQGQQVFFFCYDDQNTAAAQSGEALARELERLRSVYSHAPRLDVVAHSFGGIVTRAALSSLANPSWLSPSTNAANPRAGFETMRVRTIDTPWQGSSTGPAIPILGVIIEWFIHLIFLLIGREAMWEMRSSSATLTHLHDTELTNVDLQNIAAHQPAERDRIPSLEDLNDDARLEVVRFIVGGTTPQDQQARNWARMLSRDARYTELRSAVLAAVERNELSTSNAERTRALLEISERIMPTATGSHTSILHASDPLLDRLARELL